MSRLDIIIFGASGFTGRHAIAHLQKLTKAEGRNFSWGVAGRSVGKLKDILSSEAQKLGVDLSFVPIIQCDVKDADSCAAMAARCRIVINCCGPFRFYGESVIRACIEAGTHHLDISGETVFIGRMHLEYHDEAQKKGVYVVSACGWDSIPADMGSMFLIKHCNDERSILNSIETYLEIDIVGDRKFSGSSLNYGTWESLVYGVGDLKNLGEIRKKLCHNKPYPPLNPVLKRKPHFYRSPDMNEKWCLPFLGSDRTIMQGTQRHMYENENKRPVQVRTYFGVESLMTVFLMAIFGAVLLLLAKFEWGKKLLLNHPALFSLGKVTQEHPPLEKNANTRFRITLVGDGWSERVLNKSQSSGHDTFHIDTPIDRRIVARVSGMDPGYVATTLALVSSAMVILEEEDKLPGKGGVYSPGAAFKDTTLVERLAAGGMKFEILSKKYLN